MRFFERKRVVFAISMLAAAALAHGGRQARFHGLVSDTQGNPIPGAVITITGDPARGLIEFNKVITTDKHGKFTALILDATQFYVFHVEATGYQPQERPFKVQAGTTGSKVAEVGFFGYRATSNEFNFQLLSIMEATAAGQIELIQQPGYKELEEARGLYKAGDTEGARAKFEEAVAAEPDLLPALSGLAEFNYFEGNMEGALAAARMCFEQDDGYIQCLAIAANASQALGDEEAHAAYMAQYEDLNPDVH